MPLSWNEIKDRALKFSREWAGESSEDAEAKSFWNDFFEVFGVKCRRVATFEEPVRRLYRPELWVLRALSWTYFKVFEPLGLALWDTHDPLSCLQNMGGWTCERTTYFFGNFQIITATKQ